MLVEAHYADGRFAVLDVDGLVEALSAARGEHVLGAVIVNILDCGHKLVASINANSADFVWWGDYADYS